MKIEYNAFLGCDEIMEIEVPSSVTEIDDDAFSGIGTVYINKTEAECEELGWTTTKLGCAELIYAE